MKKTKLFIVLLLLACIMSACATTAPKVVIYDEPETENLDGNLSVEEITGDNNIADKNSSGIDVAEKDFGGARLIPDDMKKDFYDFKSYVDDRLIRLSTEVYELKETAINHGKRLDWLDSKIAEANENTDLNAVKGYYIFLPAFENEQNEINNDQKEVLDDIIKRINAGEYIAGENIDAYASLSGSDEYNIKLSQKRAENTVAYLVKKLGPEKAVPWNPKATWKNYFKATGHGKTEKYGEEKYNRRVRLTKLTKN